MPGLQGHWPVVALQEALCEPRGSHWQGAQPSPESRPQKPCCGAKRTVTISRQCCGWLDIQSPKNCHCPEEKKIKKFTNLAGVAGAPHDARLALAAARDDVARRVEGARRVAPAPWNRADSMVETRVPQYQSLRENCQKRLFLPKKWTSSAVKLQSFNEILKLLFTFTLEIELAEISSASQG